MSSVWSDLPFETLHLILGLLPPKLSLKTITQCTLVCKGWRLAAEHHLYSELKISSVQTLIKFNNTFAESNSNVAALVKKLDLSIPFIDSRGSIDHVYTLLSNLPNLQHFQPPASSDIYMQLTDAIMDGKLPNLSTIVEATSRFINSDHYVTCALLIKHRLQNVFLLGDSIYNRRLYDRLHKFEKLETVIVKKTSVNMIEDLELILEKCLTLKNITAHLQMRERRREVRDSVEEQGPLLLCSPSNNISTFELVITDILLESSHILYIMRKFPRLKNLRLVGGCKFVDLLLLDQFITYLTNVNSINIDRMVSKPEWIYYTIICYWAAMRAKNTKRLETLIISLERELSLHLSSESTAIEGPLSGDWLKRVLEKNGKYIGTLQINSIRKTYSFRKEDEAIEAFYKSIPKHLKNLKNLSFNRCDIKKTVKNDNFVALPSKYSTLQKLDFSDCDIAINAFSPLFGEIKYIDHLNFTDCKFRNFDNKITSWIEIFLPLTKLNIVSIIRHRTPHRDTQCLFLAIAKIDKESSDPQDLFYMYDMEMMEDNLFKQISEEMYFHQAYSTSTHIRLSCQGVVLLQVEIEGLRIILPSILNK